MKIVIVLIVIGLIGIGYSLCPKEDKIFKRYWARNSHLNSKYTKSGLRIWDTQILTANGWEWEGIEL